jgi:integrating conjugative element protein (TIGR03759 family)
MIRNAPRCGFGMERRETWLRSGLFSGVGRSRRVGFSRIFAPRGSATLGGQLSGTEAAKKIRANFLKWLIRGGVVLGVAAAFLSTVTCPLAAESTAVQERSVLGAPTGTAPHGEAPTLVNGFNRQEWGLTEAEWQRYQTLLQGIRGSISPATLSPIEVLGIHARDDKERADYARRWAKLMQEDTARILAFQGAYDQAYATLSPGAPRAAISGQPLQAVDAAQAGDRLLLFVRLEDCSRCEQRVGEALALRRTSGAKLDIFVVGEATDDAIRAWAARLRIDPAAVRDRRLTLNHDRGELVRVAGVAATVPVLVRMREGAAIRLETPFPS